MTDLKGLKHIAGTKTCKRKSLITQMTDANGTDHSDRQTIADIFAEFYQKLYASRIGQHEPLSLGSCQDVPKFTRMELETAIKGLKNGRARDGAGVFAELLKTGGPKLVDLLLDSYNQAISASAMPSQSWKFSTVSVLHKSGDHRKPENYRPITIIPLLYKFFAKLLYSRLQPLLDRQQSIDQAGFRPNFSTLHHISTFVFISEKAFEWQQPVWVAALDFRKAFDTVEHECLWKSPKSQGLPDGYIRVLANLYAGRSGQVRTDRISRPFDIMRGTKQGDPLSCILFNAILEDIMREVKPTSVQQNWWLQLGHTELSHLTNL